MPSSRWVRAVIFLAAGAWLVAAILMGVPVDREWTKPLGIATSATVLFLQLFDLLLWKYLPFALTRVPKLGGTWRATVESSFKDQNGSPTTLECFLVIRQSYSAVHIEMLFPKSESSSTSASIVRTDGTTELWYSYRSEAHSLDRTGNPPHKGAAQLRIAMNGGIKLTGGYWTDRETHGRIQTTGHTQKVINDYEAAQSALGAAG